MSFRIIPPETKAAALEECLRLENVKETAEKYSLDPDTIRFQFKRLKVQLTRIVANEKPGPKPKEVEATPHSSVSLAKDDSQRPESCCKCGSTSIWKNGTYKVINWLFFLAIRFFLPLRTTIQRYKCASCGAEIPSQKRHLLALARLESKKRIQRLIAFCRFKARLSNRRTEYHNCFHFLFSFHQWQ